MSVGPKMQARWSVARAFLAAPFRNERFRPIVLVKYRFSQSHLGDSMSLPNKIRQIFVREVLGRASPLELAEHLL